MALILKDKDGNYITRPITHPATDEQVREQLKELLSTLSLNKNTLGKTMNCLGDSITYGYTPSTGVQMTTPYPKKLQELLMLDVCNNYGISESTLAYTASAETRPMCERVDEMADGADIVCVFGGTNDYKYAIPMGDIDDEVNTTLYGALNLIVKRLVAKYPSAFIFFITPTQRTNLIGNNSQGYDLADVANVIKAVGVKYSMPVLDLYTMGGFYLFDETFKSMYGGDGVHPSQAFVIERLAPTIANFIATHV